MYGKRLSEITDDFLLKILALYNTIVGGREYKLYPPQRTAEITRELAKGWSIEWRLGSSLSYHSKLWIETAARIEGDWIVSFRLAVNLDKPDDKRAIALEEKFGEAMDCFLKENDGILMLNTRR